MYIYFALVAIIGLVAGIVIAARSKKAESVVYGKLDKAGIVTNILLIPAYLGISPFCMFSTVVTVEISRRNQHPIARFQLLLALSRQPNPSSTDKKMT